jgi:hypothetical protein
MDTLCLSSGGVYGICFVSCINYLLNNNYINLNKINKYVGTSAGSIISFLLIINYSLEEIRNILINLDLNTILPNIDLDNLFFEFGLDNNEKLKNLLNEFCIKKLKRNDITFKELYDLTQKELIVIATNYTIGREAILSYKTTPDLLVIDGILMSSCMPFIYKPILYKNNYYIDGAVSCYIGYKYCNPETTLFINIILKHKMCNNLDNLAVYLRNILLILNNNASFSSLNLFQCKINEKLNKENYKIINIYTDNCDVNILTIKNEIIFRLLDLGELYAKKYYVKEIKKRIQYIKYNIKKKS